MRESASAENPKRMTGVSRFFSHGRGAAIPLVGFMLALTAASAALLVHTVGVRLRRDVARLVLEDRLEVLESARWRVAASERMLRDAEGAPEPPHDRPYLVISLEERHLWYKQRGVILFSTEVATGSGKTMVKEGGASAWKFETPRGRLVVQSKEEAPVWAPPDWHYVEQSRKRGLGLARLEIGQSLAVADGSVITVEGNDVVRALPDGRRNVLQATDGREIVVDGKVLVPPLGTTQRRYPGILGTHRLNLGDGYAIHGTNQPQTVGRAVSHGCVRLRNEDIAKLYAMVPVGTPVYIY
jgi:lipoprotein-anchoring transpeptidase ErfK/SrfK